MEIQRRVLMARKCIEKYLETFKGVDKYMTDIVEFVIVQYKQKNLNINFIIIF